MSTTFDIINPATSAVLGSVRDAGPAEARAAIDRSVAAFASWKARTAFERGDVLRRWRDAILGHEDALARLL